MPVQSDGPKHTRWSLICSFTGPAPSSYLSKLSEEHPHPLGCTRQDPCQVKMTPSSRWRTAAMVLAPKQGRPSHDRYVLSLTSPSCYGQARQQMTSSLHTRFVCSTVNFLRAGVELVLFRQVGRRSLSPWPYYLSSLPPWRTQHKIQTTKTCTDLSTDQNPQLPRVVTVE